MKNKICTLSFVLLAIVTIKSQVALGKQSVTNSSVSLEFGTGFRGIILPYIPDVSKMISPAPGTIYLDAATGVVNYIKDQGAAQLFSASGVGKINGVSTKLSQPVDTVLQTSLKENKAAKVTVGGLTSVDGVFVLSATDKAMILPKMDSPHLNITNPAPGMMAYDTKMHQVAIFNGSVWTFWKP